MRRLRQLTAFAFVSCLIVANSTAARASTTPPPPNGDPWLALSMLTPSGSIGLAGAAVAAQPEAPPPPPPHYTGSSTPPLPVIALWLGVIAVDIYLLLRHDHHHGHPNSPD
jgi:hypothetical protein